MKILQRKILHLVDALDLLYQKLRVADQLQCFVSVGGGVLQRRDQPLIFGDVVCLNAEILGDSRDRQRIGAAGDRAKGLDQHGT